MNENFDEQNYLSASNFVLIIEKCPEVSMNIQTCNLPGITFGQSTVANPFIDYSVPGTHCSTDHLDMKFLVDKNMYNWIYMWTWLSKLGFKRNYEMFKELKPNYKEILTNPNRINFEYTDVELVFLDNNKNEMGVRAHFSDCFPIEVGSLEFDTTLAEEQPVTCDVRFQYTDYTIYTTYQDPI